MSELIELREFTQVTKAKRIDEEAGILYGLAALGPSSQNGRDYPEDTQRRALPLLEGQQSFVNHTKGSAEPSIYDLLGVWRNLHVKEGKTWGDFHFFKSHPLAGRLVEAARRPELNTSMGFSINASGRGQSRNGRHVIESIEKVYSIDCVAQPATLAGLYESRSHPVKSKIKDLTESLKATRPGYSRALREMAEAGVVSPDAMMDAPPDAPANDSVDHEQAILDACKACLDDSSLDTPAKMKKIKQLLKVMNGKAKDSPAEPDADDDPSTPESRQRKADANLREENARLKCRELLRTAADEAKVVLPKALLESVRPDLSEAEAKALVAEFRSGGGGSQRPRSAGPLPPQGGTGAVVGAPVRESKDDRKAIAARINGRG